MSRKKRKHRKRKADNETKKLARSQVKELIDFSLQVFTDHPVFARNALKIARKIAMKTNLRLDDELKLTHCKKCHVPFTSSTIRVRTANKGQRKVIYTCKNCGFRKRFLIRNKDAS
ncbi:MAG: hypothetical protein ACXAEU_05675 [Candidatus Hodarchaeales archaeon]|jgi:RNase P subunit RPR2